MRVAALEVEERATVEVAVRAVVAEDMVAREGRTAVLLVAMVAAVALVAAAVWVAHAVTAVRVAAAAPAAEMAVGSPAAPSRLDTSRLARWRSR